MPSGSPSADVQKQGAWNAALETGLASPLDDAILSAGAPDLSTVRKLAEIPFDFVRKRVSVVVDAEGTDVPHHQGRVSPRARDLHAICRRRVARCRGEGTPRGALPSLERPGDPGPGRGVTNGGAASPPYSRELERDLTFVGFLTFFDRPKEDAADAIRSLAALGVSIKIITGDCKPVTQHVAALVGLRADRVLTGSRPSTPVRRSAVARGRIHGSLRRGRSESEGADHPGR